MPPRKIKKQIFPATRTNRTESSITPVQRISRTTTRIIDSNTQLFPPQKRISKKSKRTLQKKPASKGQFSSYDKKARPKKIGLEKHTLDLKG